ncbi:MAG TPA: S9 family peptidase [Gammaproteobacteria bacterium]|jgi:dipeptidyl aminopeptidase/acylaminoacyl peptidase|nr:S9 family peptidase [Gammaproteobacteria bacterium]
MKSLFAALALSLISLPVLAADGPHPFDAHDLVMMDRVSDPQLSPDGSAVAFAVRETDYAANKGVTSVWVLDLKQTDAAPVKLAEGNSPRWSADGKSIYYLYSKSGSTQLWQTAAANGTPVQLSSYPLDINDFKLSPDGKHVLLSMDVFTDCTDLACSKARLDARAANKASGRLYTRLFIRHWDTWMDGRRSQLFMAAIGADGKLDASPVWLTHGMDADVPSKPEGDDSEYNFSPDGGTVYFDARIAGTSEAWSTNFDIYSVPADGSAAPKNLTAANKAWDGFPLVSPDGKTLYYLAMKTPGFEADRFGIMARDIASGQTREVDAHWDRSASQLQISADGNTLYTDTDDWGNHVLFTVDTKSGKVTKLTGDGTVTGFDLVGSRLIVAHQDFKHPTDLYLSDASGQGARQVTHFNAARLATIQFGDYQFFTFKGWHGDTVQGYVVKPVGYVAGKKYPVAFIIHGGPQGAWTDDFHYRWNPETYAGQGFAVVAINFHGSTGYGQAFTDAISQHWGDRPLEDLQKGWAAALKDNAFLDQDRACALGASYGGYMTYWIAGVWNKPWKCLVDHDGVFDNRLMYYATEELWFAEHENGGTQYEHPADFEKFNPLDHVKDWRVPMLVVHSSHDYRIPETQGYSAFTALQRRSIPSELLTFPDESHFVQKPQNSVMWHETVNAWLKRWTTTDSPKPEDAH